MARLREQGVDDGAENNLDHIVAGIGPSLGLPALNGHNSLSYHCPGRAVGQLDWVSAGRSDSLSCQLSLVLSEWRNGRRASLRC